MSPLMNSLLSVPLAVAATIAALSCINSDPLIDDDKAERTIVQTRKSDADRDSWPMFRGDSKSTGVANTTLPGELEVLWEFKVPQGAFEASAAVVEKHAYVADLDGKLFCFDLHSGEKKWEFSTELGFAAAISVKDGLVYLGDIDGKFFCIDKDGNEKWSFQTNGEISSAANFYKDNVLFGSQDATLYCLNAISGKEVWRLELEDQIRCTPTIVENRSFVAGCDGFLHIIDIDTGKSAGKVEIESPTGSTPAVWGEHVFFGSEQAGFFAVNWKKLDVAWRFLDDDQTNSIRSSAAVTDDGMSSKVIFGTRTRKVYALDPRTGEEAWSFSTHSKIDSSPVVAGEHVVVAGTDGRIYLLNLKDGKKVWEKQFDGGFVASPAVSQGKVVIATNRGVVYCLGKKNN